MSQLLNQALITQLQEEMGDTAWQTAMHIFMSETTEQISKLDDAASEEDWQAVQRASHTIKGLAGTFGASKLQEMAEAIDALAKREASHQIVVQLPSVKKVWQTTQQSYRAF